MGATTAAICLCAWLQSVGATVCYVEANGSRHLAAFAKGYDMEQEDSGWQFEGVQYRSEPGQAVNFLVYDVGSDLAARQKLLDDAHLLLLVCGAKPYEFPYTVKLCRKTAADHAYILCPFVTEDSREDVAAALQSNYHKVLFLEYQPEPTNGSVQAKAFKTMIAKYITGA